MNIDQLAVELLCELRDDKSLEWMANRAGVSKAQFHRWENNKNKIRWDKFCHICQVRRKTIPDSYYSISGSRINYQDTNNFIRILYEIIGESRIISALGISRHTLKRWVSAKAVPSLNQMLMLIQCSGEFMLINFVRSIAENPQSKLIKNWIDESAKEVDFTYNYPEVAALLRCIELDDYVKAAKHEEGFIAKQLNLSIEFENFLLKILLEHGIITFAEDKYISQRRAVDTVGKFKENASIKAYWLQKTADFASALEQPPEKSMFAHNVYCASPSGQKKIMDLYHKFYEEVRDVISCDDKPSEVFILGVQIFCPSKQEMLSGKIDLKEKKL